MFLGLILIYYEYQLNGFSVQFFLLTFEKEK